MFYVGTADKKTLTKKITMGKNARFKIIVDESRMTYVTSGNHMASLSSEWVITDPGHVKDLRKFNSLYKKTKRKNRNRKTTNNLF